MWKESRLGMKNTISSLDNFKSVKAYITFRVVCSFHKNWNCSTMTSFIWLIWSISSSSQYFFFPSWPSRLYARKYPWVKGSRLAWGSVVLTLKLWCGSSPVRWQVTVASGSVPMIPMWLTQRVQGQNYRISWILLDPLNPVKFSKSSVYLSEFSVVKRGECVIHITVL